MKRGIRPASPLPPQQLRIFADAKRVMAQRNIAVFEQQLALATAEVVVTPNELALPAVQEMIDSDTIGIAGRAPDGFVVMLAPGQRLSFFKRVLSLCAAKPFLPDFLQRNELN